MNNPESERQGQSLIRKTVEGGLSTMAQKILITLNSGPGDPGTATAAFMAARGLVEKGHDVYNYLLLSDVLLFCEQHSNLLL